MHIAVDVKNLALYRAGIAQFFAPLLAHWIAERPQHRFTLLGPAFDSARLPGSGNWRHVEVPWPAVLPRRARHPYYDYVAFPLALRRVRPEFVFTPYHDVRLPRRPASALMIHDSCLDALRDAYPRLLRWYYVYTLRRNLERASAVLTVSQASAGCIRRRYRLGARPLHVVYNACHPDFLAATADAARVAALRERLGRGAPLLLYPGGADFRKNVPRLVDALRLLCEDEAAPPVLAVTGEPNATWLAALSTASGRQRERVTFLGYLENDALRLHYEAADAVVYPSLCEGFGRVCLESRVTGTPLACSDLPVMREVAGDGAYYFDPRNARDIARKARLALAAARRPPVVDERYTPDAICRQFLSVMDGLCPP